MSFFITEKETEHWLELETRNLHFPAGKTKPFTETRLTWRSLDYIIQTSDITQQELIQWAIDWGHRENLDFKITFPNMLVYAHRELRHSRGID